MKDPTGETKKTKTSFQEKKATRLIWSVVLDFSGTFQWVIFKLLLWVGRVAERGIFQVRVAVWLLVRGRHQKQKDADTV